MSMMPVTLDFTSKTVADDASPLQIETPPDLNLEVNVTDQRLTPIIRKRM